MIISGSNKTVCHVFAFILQKPIQQAAWLSGSATVSINEVTIRRARLVLGWVTVCGRVNHLGS